MSSKQFFNIVLKIFGLFFLREILNTVPQLISTLIMMFTDEDVSKSLFIFLGAFIVLTFYIVMTYQLIFKTPRIVEKLKLDQDFNEQRFDFKIPKAEVLNISLIVIAGIILVNQIPILVVDIFEIVQVKRFSFGETKTDYTYVIISVVKIIIAALLLGERVRIVDFILARQAKTDKVQILEKSDDKDQ